MFPDVRGVVHVLDYDNDIMEDGGSMVAKVVELTEYAIVLIDISDIKMHTLVGMSSEPEFTFELKTSESKHSISVYVSVLGEDNDSFMVRFYDNSLELKLTTEAKELIELKLIQIIKMLLGWLEIKGGGVAIKCSNS